MGLLDLFTGAASNKAAKQNAAAIAQGQAQANQSLAGNADQSLKLLGIGSGLGGGSALSSLQSGFGQARQDLGAASDKVQGLLGQAGQLYQGLTQNGLEASNARSDALGLNGADGLARAKAAFTGSLGYNAGLDEGLDAIQRTAAARGGLAGGNATRDLFNYAADYQNRQAGSYLDRLNTVSNDYTTGLSGQAGALGSQASAAQNSGNALAALGTGLGTGQAGVYNQGSNTFSQLGRDQANVFNNATSQTIANNNNLAASQNAAGANILGAITGGLSLLGGGAGSAAGRASATGGANVSPYAGNPFLSAIGNIFG